MNAHYPEAPVIDVFGLSAEAAAVRQATLQQITEAITRNGVFVAWGIPGAEDLDTLAAVMLRFFNLEDDEKQAVATQRMRPESPHRYRGYARSRPEQRFAYTEIFDIGPDRRVAYPPLRDADMFAEPNAWPARQPVAGWRQAMRTYFDALERCATRLLLSLADFIAIPEDEIRRRFSGGNSTLRLLHYPPRPKNIVVEDEPERGYGDPDEPPMAIGRHTDGCCLSLLWQRAPGLQGQAPDGTWHEVPQHANAVSVHIGDMVETMSGGRIPATPHRVLDRVSDRFSIGFFLEPKLVASCAPFGTTPHPENPDLDSYAALLLRRFSTYPGYEHIAPPD